MDASLKELTSLVREVNPESRQKGTYFDIARVLPATGRGHTGPNGQFCNYHMRGIGTTVSGKKGVDDSKTLKDATFEIVDYVDIAITPPSASGFEPGFAADRRSDRSRGEVGGGGGRERRGGGFGRRD